MMSIANVARLKYSGNLSSGWWVGLAIRPAWDFALSKNGELFARPESVRVDTTAKAIDPSEPDSAADIAHELRMSV